MMSKSEADMSHTLGLSEQRFPTNLQEKTLIEIM